MRLLIDEDSQANRLIDRLRGAGHDVLTAREAELMGRPDREVLARAARDRRVVLTRNVDDFAALQVAVPDHAGILGIYQDADSKKDMGYADVVRAIGNVEASGLELPGVLVVLNAWRW